MVPVLVLMLTACQGCASCYTPNLGQNNNQQSNQNSSNDDGDDPSDGGGAGAATGDITDPPPCDVPEEEPNDARSEAQELPPERWACGFISEQGDIESFNTVAIEDGWMTVWARGAAFGSTADLQVLLEDLDDNDRKAGQSWMPGSTDALLTVPVEAGTEWLVQVVDDQSTYSDSHEWQLIATIDKPPVEWDFAEDDEVSNNAIWSGLRLEDGDVVYGTLERNDQDFWTFEVPEGRTVVYVRVHAWNFGSPADTRVTLYRPDETVERAKSTGETTYDKDPLIDRTIYDPGTWALKVDLAGAGGSPLYWYTVECGLGNTPPGTGEAAAG